MRPIAFGLACAWLAGPALARAEPKVAGLRVASRGAEASVRATASFDDLGQRRAVRGATLDVHESAELRAMREWEEERFARARAKEIADSFAVRVPAAELARLGYDRLALPDLGMRWDPRVVRYLDFYKNERRGRAIMGAWLARQGRYRALIEDALSRHHLPHALLYVSMIESGYDPRDRSGAGAAGLWQFMPEGARIYGLRVDHWLDERLDPEKSTEAAMRYLGDLHARFQSWPLALGAFNAGYGAALAAIAKYNSNDYWTLARLEDGLPWETVQYVPKALATAIVGENRAAFGFDRVAPQPELSFDRVAVPAFTTLANVARAAGASLDEVANLNPELLRGRTPPSPERWNVRVPRGTGAHLLERLVPSRERLGPYVVQPGDRLESIAKAARASTGELKRINAIKDAAEVRPGVVLAVPLGDRAADRAQDGTRDRASDKAGEHAPRDGEPTLIALWDRPPPAGSDGRKRLFYRVAPGDGLSEIARFFDVREEDLAAWNALDPDARLVSSQVLTVWVPLADDLAERIAQGTIDAAHARLVTVGSGEFFDEVERRRGRKRLLVTVREGDTWRSIGARYGLTDADLERINQAPRSAALAAGQAVVVYDSQRRRAPTPPSERTPPDANAPFALALDDEGPPPLAALRAAVTIEKTACDDAPAAIAPQPPPADDPCFALAAAGVLDAPDDDDDDDDDGDATPPGGAPLALEPGAAAPGGADAAPLPRLPRLPPALAPRAGGAPEPDGRARSRPARRAHYLPRP